MKRNYDFSNATQGKFYRKNARVRIPIYLDTKLQSKLERIARDTGKDVDDIVTRIVRKEVSLLEELM
jgi:cytidylate kinase